MSRLSLLLLACFCSGDCKTIQLISLYPVWILSIDLHSAVRVIMSKGDSEHFLPLLNIRDPPYSQDPVSSYSLALKALHKLVLLIPPEPFISQLSKNLFFALFYFPWLIPICTYILNLEDGSSRKIHLTLKFSLDIHPIYLGTCTFLWSLVTLYCNSLFVCIFPLESNCKFRDFMYFFPFQGIWCAHSVLWIVLALCLWNVE